jgi:hypothetical protein
MKVQDRISPIYERIYADKNSNQDFHMESIRIADSQAIINRARKYRMLLFKLGDKFYWTWIGDRNWYKRKTGLQNYSKEKVLKAVVDDVIQNSNFKGNTIIMLNPTGQIDLDWFDDKYTITNINTASNRLFQLLKL